MLRAYLRWVVNVVAMICAALVVFFAAQGQFGQALGSLLVPLVVFGRQVWRGYRAEGEVAT
ncbi:hypothetical protein [Halosimplex marinum]|uniref:hypothetical protein n=1 Tax=Halosimplex marinum TaxID=3396620 RepID=UPI003F55F93F